jgi:hypothetical protein
VSTDAGTITLPLLTLGLPARVSGWLLDAGLPCAPVDTAAIRRGIAPDEPGRPIVLFDSRDASARTDAEDAVTLGYETIDAARLFAVRPADDPDFAPVLAADPRRRFLDSLPGAIAAAGGLWVRIADFPHPYRWAVCGDADAFDPGDDSSHAAALSAFGELPAAGGDPSQAPTFGRVSAADWLRRCAAAGRPVQVAGNAAEAIGHHGINLGGLPLGWVATMSDFAAWWRLRRRLSLRAIRRGKTCELELYVPADASDRRFLPAVEIWRGQHHAVVPLRPGITVLRDDTLPFQLNATRHHAGFTADAVDPDFAGVMERTVLATV